MKEKILNSALIKGLSSLTLIKKLKENRFISKILNYEVISYVIVGFLTTVINYIVHFLMPRFGTSGLDVALASVVAWCAAVAFAFPANKVFVFDSPSWERRTVVRELLPFITARLLSLGFDALFMFITAGRLHFNEPLMKVLSSIVVLTANYLASKFLIFKKQETPEDTESEQP